MDMESPENLREQLDRAFLLIAQMDLEAAGMRHVLRRLRDVFAQTDTLDADGNRVPDMVIQTIDQALSGDLGREMERDYAELRKLLDHPGS